MLDLLLEGLLHTGLALVFGVVLLLRGLFLVRVILLGGVVQRSSGRSLCIISDFLSRDFGFLHRKQMLTLVVGFLVLVTFSGLAAGLLVFGIIGLIFLGGLALDVNFRTLNHVFEA